SIFGTGALTEFRAEVAPKSQPGKKKPLKFAAARADRSPEKHTQNPIFHDRGKKERVVGPVAMAIDGDDLTAWSNDLDPGRRNEPRCAVFIPEKPVHHPGGMRITFRL